jgi:hypothetical protein
MIASSQVARLSATTASQCRTASDQTWTFKITMVFLNLTDIQDHNRLLKVMYVNSWQQPPEHKGDVDADGVEGEAEHDRPNVAAYWANIIAAGHRCRLALIRASSVLAVASTLVAEAAISLNLAVCNDGWRGWRKDSARGRHAVGGN